MLRAAFNLYKARSGHITTSDLKHTDQISLAQFMGFANFSNILTNPNILLDFFVPYQHSQSGLNLVHFGLLIYCDTMGLKQVHLEELVNLQIDKERK